MRPAARIQRSISTTTQSSKSRLTPRSCHLLPLPGIYLGSRRAESKGIAEGWGLGGLTELSKVPLNTPFSKLSNESTQSGAGHTQATLPYQNKANSSYDRRMYSHRSEYLPVAPVSFVYGLSLLARFGACFVYSRVQFQEAISISLCDRWSVRQTKE